METSVGVSTYLAPSRPEAAPVPWGGWTFKLTGSTGVTLDPTSLTTGSFPDPDLVFSDVSFDGQADSATVTFTPVPRNGYVLAQQSGANASCYSRPADGRSPSESVQVTNVGDTGFSIPVLTELVDCSVYYRQLPGPPRLTLIDDVVNDDGGAAHASDWTLYANGPIRVGGHLGDSTVTNVKLIAGTYVLDESGPPGYNSGAWSCRGGTMTNGWTLVLKDGDGAVCTITNDDRPTRLTLVDTTTNDNGGTARPADWTLTATGPTTITGRTGDSSVTDAAVKAGTYTLDASGPSGYTGTWSCSSHRLNGSTLVLDTGDDETCTLASDDQAAHLTLVDQVTNDNGGTARPADWTLTATGPTTISGHTGDPAVTGAAVDAGSYTLSETGPAGYAGSWSCTPDTLTGSTVVVANGADVTCTATNDDRAAHLTLIAHVVNDDGGTARPADWTLSATGPTAVTGRSGDPAVTDVEVDPGSYRLAEAGGPAGYAHSDWVCSGGIQEVPGAPVLLGGGESAICTITDDDRPARLTLISRVVNGGSGGTATPDQWTLAATGATSIGGRANSAAVTDRTIDAGSYLLSESGGPRGYVAGAWSCSGGTVTRNRLAAVNGAAVVCTVTNSAQEPALTLIKVVRGGAGGTAASPSAWQLGAAGPRTIGGVSGSAAVTRVPLPIGTYDLTESGPSGFRSSGWVCVGATGSAPAGAVSLSLGDRAVCTSTSTATRPTLTLVGGVDNGLSGGTAEPTDWILTASNRSDRIRGVTGSPAVTRAPAEVGTYALAESGPPGYARSGWVCVGAAGSTATSVTLALGDHATCTVGNTARQPRLTLLADVTNDDQGTSTGADWILVATGPTPGVSGQGGVTALPVSAGAYRLTESGPEGYTLRAWSCDGATRHGTSVVVALGGDVTCVAHLDDKPAEPTLTLSPDLTSTHVGSRFGVTAQVRRAGQPAADVVVHFVSRLPGQEDKTGSDRTDAAGRAGYHFTRTVAGADIVTATARVGGRTLVARIHHRWTATPAKIPETSPTVRPQGAARPGGSLQLSGTGCRPGGVVDIDLRNADGLTVRLGTTTAAADGSFYLNTSVPTVPLGRYTLHTSCGKPSGDPTVDISGPESTLAVTGIAAAGATTGSLLVFFLLLVKGIISFMPNRFR
ncbi:hypothetical protein [Microlunatus ginsengisoli]|uniref:hypothetical protein n=1 Tax=Microlunatus ginsengisoli TaxID=363863 RepID=UPI0031DDD660